MGSQEGNRPDASIVEPIVAELVEEDPFSSLPPGLIPVASLAPPTQKRIDVFSAPRRFDLATLFVVSIAYSMLFATIRAVNWGIMANAMLGGLVTLVGLAQAILFRGEAPRQSSVIAGAVYAPIAISIYMLSFRRTPETFEVLLAAITSIPFGAMFGYLAGAVVGGVFLIAHHIRKRFS